LSGFLIARKWGGLKSAVGLAVFFISAGLFCQFLGQLSYTYLYYINHIENAYPAFGEIFFVASIPMYVLGIYYIAKASGFDISLRSFKEKPLAAIIPIVLVATSYHFLLGGYDGTGAPFINVFLDYFYPLGQALFVSLAIVTFYATNKSLGGIMKGKVLFILFALVFQYAADSLFIYETSIETWFPGGISDLLFLISYFLMTISLIKFYNIAADLKRYNNKEAEN
jgi:hypothetical protein